VHQQKLYDLFIATKGTTVLEAENLSNVDFKKKIKLGQKQQNGLQ